jgi:hypothetical protein
MSDLFVGLNPTETASLETGNDLSFSFSWFILLPGE